MLKINVVVHIESNYELFEVLNAFPVLKRSLERLDFKVSDIPEGISVHDYFKEKHLTEDEIDLMLRKFNNEVKLHFKEKHVECKKESEIEIIRF